MLIDDVGRFDNVLASVSMSMCGATPVAGLGTHAPGVIDYFLGSRCSPFTGTVGIDAEVGDRGQVCFEAWNGERLAEAEATGAGDGVPLDVPVDGVDLIELRTEPVDGQDYDHADWAIPVITCT